MKDITRLGLKILIAGALLGALADALLRATPWGVNLPLWAMAFAAAPCRAEGQLEELCPD